jgi:hypothetical protein
MNAAFGRDALLDAFDRIGRAAVLAGTKLRIAVYGGSALMLASNFRFATEDVDVSELERPLPAWLATALHEIARDNHWNEDWFNDGVAFHLSSIADSARTIWNLGHFRETERRPDLWFRFPRQNICLP